MSLLLGMGRQDEDWQLTKKTDVEFELTRHIHLVFPFSPVRWVSLPGAFEVSLVLRPSSSAVAAGPASR